MQFLAKHRVAPPDGHTFDHRGVGSERVSASLTHILAAIVQADEHFAVARSDVAVFPATAKKFGCSFLAVLPTLWAIIGPLVSSCSRTPVVTLRPWRMAYSSTVQHRLTGYPSWAPLTFGDLLGGGERRKTIGAEGLEHCSAACGAQQGGYHSDQVATWLAVTQQRVFICAKFHTHFEIFDECMVSRWVSIASLGCRIVPEK